MSYICLRLLAFASKQLLITSCMSVFIFLDVEVDVDELNQEQVLDVNKMATSYGMAEGDFVR